MSLLWRDTMAIGNELVDTDHRCIIGLLNTLELALLSVPDQAAAALEQLEVFAREHFRREERIQRAIEFPESSGHRESHLELEARVADIRGHIVVAMDDAQGEELARLVQRLRLWLIDHIVQEDLRLKPFLKNLPSNFSG